ncbi:dynein light chain Tctex-type 4-like [Amphiura filiformis]|uniref:dynein light chain Tctex-type 4-like n=1 Tax=Amphiura filiformis TaxID=82378 RepID=UPI003B20CD23
MSGAFIQTPLSKITDSSEPVSPSGQNVTDDDGDSLSLATPPITKNTVRFGETVKPAQSPSRRRASVLGGIGLADRRTSLAPGTSGGLIPSRRRQSMWGSLKRFTIEQGSASSRESPQEEMKLENTYQLKPTSKQMFKPSKVEQEISDILENELEGVTYNPLKVSFLSSTLSDKIKAKVKQLGFNRHKLVVYVVMGSLLGQGLELTSRSVWNERTDDCVTVRYQNNSLFATAMVFAVYHE